MENNIFLAKSTCSHCKGLCRGVWWKWGRQSRSKQRVEPSLCCPAPKQTWRELAPSWGSGRDGTVPPGSLHLSFLQRTDMKITVGPDNTWPFVISVATRWVGGWAWWSYDWWSLWFHWFYDISFLLAEVLPPLGPSHLSGHSSEGFLRAGIALPCPEMEHLRALTHRPQGAGSQPDPRTAVGKGAIGGGDRMGN